MNLLSPQWSLLAGIILSLMLQGSDWQAFAKKWSTKFLQISVVLLGASLNFNYVLAEGIEGVLITFFSIISVFLLGYLGMRAFNVDKDQGTLITMGTAICGGSAIGALSPVIKADTMAITVSIAVVFLLNSVAVFIFPFLGNVFTLTQEQFGLWSALAIHDTSSVVAASAIYGDKALEIATTVKLIRALWIIPVTLFFSFFRAEGSKGKITIPWFIFGFLAVSMLFTFAELPHSYKTTVTGIAKSGFAVTLFLIGLTFEFKKIKSVGLRPLMLATGLWVIVSVLSLIFIKTYV